MAWQTSPSDPVFSVRGYQVALHIFADDMGDQIVMMSRLDASMPWVSVGGSDGTVWMGDYAREVKTMGFTAWLAKVLALVNARLAAWIQANFGTAPTSDPLTFADFQLWARDNLVLTGETVARK